MSTYPEIPPRPRSSLGAVLFCLGFTALGFLLPMVAAIVMDDGSGEGGAKGLFLVFGLFASTVTGPLALIVSLICVAIHRWVTSKYPVP